MLPEDPAHLPWPFIMASVSLVTILAFYHLRPDVFSRFGFGRQEVALLSLGAIAGWAVNLPVLPIGSSYLALNLGGAILCLILAGIWIARRHLPLVRTAIGVTLVAVVTHRIVVFEPSMGIIAVFPWFFLPPLVALLYALVTTIGEANRTVPVAFTAGSIGALVGADLVNLPLITEYFSQEVGEAAVVSVGGAGVFDMVFLAGILPMAASVVVLSAVLERPWRRTITYPGEAWTIHEARTTWDRYARLTEPNDLERAVAALALSDRAFEVGDHAKSVRMSRLAVEALLEHPAIDQGEFPIDLRYDLAALDQVATGADAGHATREEAGGANRTAHLAIGALAPVTDLPCRLEGH